MTTTTAATSTEPSLDPRCTPPREPLDLRAVFDRLKAAARRRAPTCDERLEALERLDRALLARKEALVSAIGADYGHRSRHETLMGDVLPVHGAIEHARERLRDWMEPQERETGWVHWPSTAQVIHQPLGVVGIISPWNFPGQLSLWPLVGAIAAGNRVMLKPSELSPRFVDVLCSLLAEAFTEDWVAVVTGGPEVGQAFAALPFDHLVFTGSTRVGKLVMRAASENLVPLTLELGGKSPAIVSHDFDVRTAAERILAGKTFNAGQACIAPDYALVPSGVENAFVAEARAAVARMYPTIANNADYTAIASDAQYDRLRWIIDDAKAHGADIVELNPAREDLAAAGSRKIAPTLIVRPSDAMVCMKDEIFGPVLPIVGYTSLEEAIDFVNARPRPLALYYFGHKRAHIDRVLNETVSGGVTLNETILHILQDDLPFGGVGASGMSRYHGREGFEALSHPKPIFRQARIHPRRLALPPYRKTVDGLLRFLLGS